MATSTATDTRALRDSFGQFTTGVTVVTSAGTDGVPHGATVNSFTSVSLEPPLVLVSLHRDSRACVNLVGAPFAVNVLRRQQQAIGLHFAGVRDTGALVRWDTPTPGAAPALENTLATFSCDPYQVVDGGDHLLFLGLVTSFEVRDGEPLVFHGGRFQRLEAERPAPVLEDFGPPGWYGDPMNRPM